MIILNLKNENYIFLKNKSKILLIHNNNLDIWIGAGGHYESSDKNIVNCVKREILEEVGLKDIKLDDWHLNNNTPLNIRSFHIPENTKKQEESHLHHDFAYVFAKNDDNESDLNMQLEEIKGAKWLSLDEAIKHNDESDGYELFSKIKKFII